MLALLSLSAFLLIERARLRAGRLVVVDLRLFSISSFSRGNIAALIVALGEFGLLFVLPLYLQGALGLSALETGAALIPLAAGTLIAGGVTPALAPRLGPRGVVQLGLLLEVLGIGTLGLLLTSTLSVWQVIPWLFIYGVGVGFATAQLTGVILTDIPVHASGQGSGIQSTFRQSRLRARDRDPRHDPRDHARLSRERPPAHRSGTATRRAEGHRQRRAHERRQRDRPAASTSRRQTNRCRVRGRAQLVRPHGRVYGGRLRTVRAALHRRVAQPTRSIGPCTPS
jgi:hypothetical protein